jgi:hypothetical protein
MQDGTALFVNAAGATPRLDGGRRRRGWLLGAVLLSATCFTAAASAATSATLAQFNRETFAYTSQLGIQPEAARYQVMVLQATDHAEVPRLKAANPALKILMYSDVLLSRTSDTKALTTCTSYANDRSSHPSWFMTDQHGQPIVDASYPGDYLMNVGNPAYQQSCVAHAISLARGYGFDGLYLDDVTAWVGWALPAGTTVPAYPTASLWQSAMYSLLSYAAPQLHAQGLLVVGNLGGAISTPGLWQRWSTPLDGSEDEAWAESGDPADWYAQMVNVAWSEANGKLTIVHTHLQTEAANTFGLASMLLVAQGRTSYSTSNANYTNSEAWYPEYRVAQALGSALDPTPSLINGIYIRRFAHGLVLANPSNSPTAVYLGGLTYSGATQTKVSSVTMGPWTGVIVLEDRYLTPTPAEASPSKSRRPFSTRVHVGRTTVLRHPARLIDRLRAEVRLSPIWTRRFRALPRGVGGYGWPVTGGAGQRWVVRRIAVARR